MEFAIFQPKMVRFPWNEKQTHRLNYRPQMWPSGLTLAMTLTLNFQGQIWNLLYLSQKWSDCLETQSKHIDWSPGLKCDHQIWPLTMTLTLNFQGQIWNFLYLDQKWSDYHETKSKHIDWTPGLNCDQWVWPWSWPWHLNFQGQMWSRSGVRIYQIRCKDLPDSDRGDFRCRAVDSSSFQMESWQQISLKVESEFYHFHSRKCL